MAFVGMYTRCDGPGGQPTYQPKTMQTTNLLTRHHHHEQRRPTLKTPVHVRLSHLPPIPELFKPSIQSIRAGDVGRLIQVMGTGECVGEWVC